MAVEAGQMQPQQPSGIRGFFSRPIAGIPLWGWAGIVVIGVGVAYFFFWRKGSSSGSDTASGLAIDPATGQAYGTNGQGGINSGGAFAGETTFDPLGRTNDLLQQILDNNNNNVNPPTSSGGNLPTGLSGFDPNTRLYTLPSGLTFQQVAAITGSRVSDLYYNKANEAIQAAARKHGGINGGFLIPKGTQVYIAGLGPASASNPPSGGIGTVHRDPPTKLVA